MSSPNATATRDLRSLLTPSPPNVVLGLLCLLYLLLYVDRVNIATAAPLIRAELGLSNTELGMVFSAFSIPYALLQLFGGYGFSGGGAAGFELDRLDHRLGSPLNAVVLASSEGHDRKNFVVVHEERLGFTTTIPGQTLEQLIRADMTYIEKPAGGAVFSVGSITYCGSLPHNKFENDVSRLTFNVLNRFGELGLRWPFGPAKA